MPEAVETLMAVADLVLLPVYLVAIVVCFLKGKPGVGWLGIGAFALGAAISVPLFRYLRANDAAAWILLPWAIGFAVGVVVIVAAIRSARDGSWWQRRNATTVTR